MPPRQHSLLKLFIFHNIFFLISTNKTTALDNIIEACGKGPSQIRYKKSSILLLADGLKTIRQPANMQAKATREQYPDSVNLFL